MVKRLMLLGIVGFMVMSFATASETPQPPKKEAEIAFNPVLPADTTLKKDAAQDKGPADDPKQVFRDIDQRWAQRSVAPPAPSLNPRIVSYVNTYADANTGLLNRISDWGKPYLELMGDILEQHGLPRELKYLAIIESNLKSTSRSKVGAVGPWQLMPETARGLGLKVNRYVDERKDYRKSTNAAAKYLTSLYKTYGDWLLTIAAYNCGPGNVNKAIRNSGSRSFWKLQNYLPRESRLHVKRYIATHYILEGEAGITTLGKKETEQYLLAVAEAAETTEPDTTQETATAAIVPAVEVNKVLIISGKYNANVISKFLQMDPAEFGRLNPDFDYVIADRGNYEMRLPDDKMTLFLANKNNILNESVQVILNQVQDPASGTSPATAKGDK